MSRVVSLKVTNDFLKFAEWDFVTRKIRCVNWLRFHEIFALFRFTFEQENLNDICEKSVLF